MANLTSTTVTGTLNTTSTITGPGSGVSAINASNVSTGTLASDRLPTVPTSKGGTGLTTIGSANQVLKVNSGGTALEFGAAGGGGNLVTQVYTGSTTWTKPADLAAVKVTVVGGGGGGGGGGFYQNQKSGGAGGGAGVSIETIPAASIPGPVAVTVGGGGAGGQSATGNQGQNPGGNGGTSSFGAFLSATGGNRGTCPNDPAGLNGVPGNSGSGSGGQINQGDTGIIGGVFFGYGYPGGATVAGYGYGGGGGPGQSSSNNNNAGAGATGLVIIDEIY